MSFDVERRWKLLSDVWTELIVYAAAPSPPSDEEHVKAHADILVEGVELVKAHANNMIVMDQALRFSVYFDNLYNC